MYVSRKALLSSVYHFVDDFTAVEPGEGSQSSFSSFTDLCHSLGLKTKSKKAAPPSTQHTLLGVEFHIQKDGVTIMPCPERVSRIQQQVQSILESDHLSATEAQKLAGRLVFLQTTVFGQVGKAALQSIYARASDRSIGSTSADNLNTGLRSLQNIAKLLTDLRPRWFPYSSSADQSLIYTDAFFELDNKLYKPNQVDITTQWRTKDTPTMKNGWGLVCRCSCGTYYAFGTVPPAVLKAYCHKEGIHILLGSHCASDHSPPHEESSGSIRDPVCGQSSCPRCVTERLWKR